VSQDNYAEYYRYCPNQPKLIISDAICRGRRRSNYPFCKGCPFNDEERARQEGSGPATSRRQQDKARTVMLEKIFKAYDIRGTYPDQLHEELAWRIGHGTASFLMSAIRGLERADPNASAIVVGRDMRKSSPSFGRWVGIELSGQNHRQLWLPPGMAHGFLVTSKSADFLYKVTHYYAPEAERCVRWDDPAIGISWPTLGIPPVLSAKDAASPLLVDAPAFD